MADFDRGTGDSDNHFPDRRQDDDAAQRTAGGDALLDFVGPLGKASEFEPGIHKVAVIGGGLGTAIAYPQAKKLSAMGVSVDMIAGFRSTDFIILEEEMRACSDNLYITTDDGSNGRKGLVTDVLRERIEAGEKYDLVIAIGPLIMMKFVCLLTKEYGIKTVHQHEPDHDRWDGHVRRMPRRRGR